MMEPTGSTTSIDPLAEMLERFESDARYRVDALIKQTQVERTERVYRLGADGAQETGPFIRKYIDRQSGLGEVYQLLFDKQQAGRRLKHVPHILDCGLIGDKLVVVMETAPGTTLAACEEATQLRSLRPLSSAPSSIATSRPPMSWSTSMRAKVTRLV